MANNAEFWVSSFRLFCSRKDFPIGTVSSAYLHKHHTKLTFKTLITKLREQEISDTTKCRGIGQHLGFFFVCLHGRIAKKILKRSLKLF